MSKFGTTSDTVPWAPRMGASVAVEEATEFNYEVPRLYLVGGRDENDFLGADEAVWSWRGEGTDWVADFTEAADVDQDEATNGAAITNFRYYLDAKSNVSLLMDVVPPDRRNGRGDIARYPLLGPTELKMLESEGILTVGDLAKASRTAILRLRGFPGRSLEREGRESSGKAFPPAFLGHEDKGEVSKVSSTEGWVMHGQRWGDDFGGADGVCDLFLLAKRVVDKCAVDTSNSNYDGEHKMPWNLRPRFRGGSPGESYLEWAARREEWQDKFDTADSAGILRGYGKQPSTAGSGAPGNAYSECSSDHWDGCSHLASCHSEQTLVPVPGMGLVSQAPPARHQLDAQAAELTCRWTPFPRAFHSAVYFANKIWIVGGKRKVDDYNDDAWYRDMRPPRAFLKQFPIDQTSETIFTFTADEESIFQYRVYYADHLKEVREWTPAYRGTNVGWLKNFNDLGEKSNSKTENGKKQKVNRGPGDGNYVFYVRAIDAAGNVDASFKNGRNLYKWRYRPGAPGGLISLIVILILALVVLALYKYREFKKQQALERYAIKRIRRKFKGIMNDGSGDKSTALRSSSEKKKKKKGKSGDKKGHSKGKHRKKHKSGKGDGKQRNRRKHRKVEDEDTALQGANTPKKKKKKKKKKKRKHRKVEDEDTALQGANKKKKKKKKKKKRVHPEDNPKTGALRGRERVGVGSDQQRSAGPHRVMKTSTKKSKLPPGTSAAGPTRRKKHRHKEGNEGTHDEEETKTRPESSPDRKMRTKGHSHSRHDHHRKHKAAHAGSEDEQATLKKRNKTHRD
eukprot:CAMPEP_0118998604 /NCGR_PEP_ID=MMETSP1173-20130426/63158_1 /TAXON_ID=1034831 /ORGANISM="Rhizochromulina marina cf, Strain CCMP1243" /LENGTH=794 /DNA_ID=CAMNT_0006950099 /DNA_START=14 /DNA_END=2398 /DNA_ORIENTATION=+